MLLGLASRLDHIDCLPSNSQIVALTPEVEAALLARKQGYISPEYDIDQGSVEHWAEVGFTRTEALCEILDRHLFPLLKTEKCEEIHPFRAHF